jgi:AraC family transcriptional regulator of arabinose operon
MHGPYRLSDVLVRHAAWTTLTLLCESYPNQVAADERVLNAMQLLVDTDWSLAACAEECQLSLSRLQHLFRDDVGVSMGAWREQHRLRQAAEDLDHRQLRIAEVAAQNGFDDPLYFSRRFKKYYGISPRAWRDAPVPARDAE